MTTNKQEDALRKLADKATRPKPETYPAHGSGMIAFYMIAETDTYIDSLLDELAALRIDNASSYKWLKETWDAGFFTDEDEWEVEAWLKRDNPTSSLAP